MDLIAWQCKYTCIGASGFAALVAIGIADFDHL
jgi:hypothetical protein